MLARSLHRLCRSTIQYQYQCSVRFINNDGETYYKSHLNLLTKEEDNHTYVEAFSPIGFRLSSGLRVLGPCALFPKAALHWNIVSSAKITPESLSLFTILEPKPDILIIGIGERGAMYDKNIIKYLRSKRINVEILPTEQACSTFNFLNSERRVVAAALIPPDHTDAYEDDSKFPVEDADPPVTRAIDGKIPALESSMDEKIGKTMERFRDEGFMKTMSDLKKDRKERNEKEDEVEDGKKAAGDDGEDKKR